MQVIFGETYIEYILPNLQMCELKNVRILYNFSLPPLLFVVLGVYNFACVVSFKAVI